MTQPAPEVSPAHLFDTINSFHRTAAIKAGIELGVFTAVAEGNTTAQTIAGRCATAERGARILCDYLVIMGFLTKVNGNYGLTPDSAAFLDRRSPTYLGSVADFLLTPTLTSGFEDLASAVRKGGTNLPDQGSVTPDHPVWVKFAQAMAPLMALPSQLIADAVPIDRSRDVKVLDIAAGHGIFGIALAQRNPRVHVIALDWPNVLEVAKGNAHAAGVGDRYTTLPGSAFDVDFERDYDLILLTNFLHHFDPSTCEGLLRKVHSALGEGGRAVTLEFIPNDDRVSPPGSAGFSLIMLGTTPSGDAYTFSELEGMFRRSGFARSEFQQLPPTMQQLVVSYK